MGYHLMDERRVPLNRRIVTISGAPIDHNQVRGYCQDISRLFSDEFPWQKKGGKLQRTHFCDASLR
jgi:hypothetical protein